MLLAPSFKIFQRIRDWCCQLSSRVRQLLLQLANSVEPFQGLCLCSIGFSDGVLSLCVGGEEQAVVLFLLFLKVLPQLLIVVLEQLNQFGVCAPCLPAALSLQLCRKLANRVEARETLIKATRPGFFVREAATPKFASS
jgi:hypothetical protein